jgi:lysophospholipase L1-like esterase
MGSMMKRFLLLLLIPALGFSEPQTELDFKRFAGEIEAFDKADAENPPEKGGIVFTGSSSIRLLSLAKVFPGLKALNRGFGGSRMPELNHYLDRCVLRYKPTTVVFYGGGNDLWDGKTPEQVEKEFHEFRDRIFANADLSRLIVLAVRPSPARASIRVQEAELNRRFKLAAETDKRIIFVPGSWDRFLDEAGVPKPELYDEDQLHMSDAGYAIWKELLSPLLPVAGK